MKKTNKVVKNVNLGLKAETIRSLSSEQLEQAVGGTSITATRVTSQCNGQTTTGSM
jgi:hypothetical protein